MNVLEVKNLTFSYDDKRNIFENINLSVSPGQVLCIIGPNGCGKTTLIDCLLGLNKPSSGEILVAETTGNFSSGSIRGVMQNSDPAAKTRDAAGAKAVYTGDNHKSAHVPDGNGLIMRDIRTMKDAQLAAHMAYVPQGHKTTFGFTVLDVVAMGRTYAQKMFSPPGEEEYAIARKSLASVGLAGFEDRDYTKLSGGELQLVIIARAITQQAQILVMDEPTAHLDFRHEMQVLEIVAKLVKEQNLSIVMATHFLNQAYYLDNTGVNTTVSLMSGGRFIREGIPGEVLTEDTLKEAFGITTEIISSDSRKYILPIGTK